VFVFRFSNSFSFQQFLIPNPFGGRGLPRYVKQAVPAQSPVAPTSPTTPQEFYPATQWVPGMEYIPSSPQQYSYYYDDGSYQEGQTYGEGEEGVTHDQNTDEYNNSHYEGTVEEQNGDNQEDQSNVENVA
jgi:hypothetical protein